MISDYFKFLAHQLKGWPQQNYYLFFFSLGCQVMTLVSAPITWVTVITFIGTTLGVLCVLAINAAKSVNGFLGILSALCFIIAGFSAKNYLSIAEQIAYVITLDLPVLLSANWNVNMASKIRKFNARSWTQLVLWFVSYKQGSATLAMAVNSSIYLINDVLAFTISPWYNERERQRLSKEEAAYAKELGLE